MPEPLHPDHRWEPGATVVLRYLTMRESRPGMSWPCRVVADRADLVALHVPAGTAYKAWSKDGGARRLVDAVWSREMLRLMFPGCGYSVWLSWAAGEERQFAGYYVNMVEPFRRTAIGFDTNDHQLDIVVTPELAWAWKDEQVLAERVRNGTYSAAFAAEVRAEAETVVKLIESRASPFGDGWERWTPDPAWTVPALPADWESAVCVPWARRGWAYGVDRVALTSVFACQCLDAPRRH